MEDVDEGRVHFEDSHALHSPGNDMTLAGLVNVVPRWNEILISVQSVQQIEGIVTVVDVEDTIGIRAQSEQRAASLS